MQDFSSLFFFSFLNDDDRVVVMLLMIFHILDFQIHGSGYPRVFFSLLLALLRKLFDK